MLPSLPPLPAPAPPGANVLALPQGAAHPSVARIAPHPLAEAGEARRGAAPALPQAPAGTQAPGLAPGLAPSLPPGLPPGLLTVAGNGTAAAPTGGAPVPQAEAALPGSAQAATAQAVIAQAATTLPVAAGAASALAAGTVSASGGAAPMSLVAAQMLGGETAAMQNLLAQQAATRALPAAPRRAPPVPADAPASAADHTPDGALNPHAPPPASVLPHPLGTAAPARPAAAPGTAEADVWAEIEAIARQMAPLVPPPGATALPRATTAWLLAGALFAGLFLFVVLTS